MGKNDQWMIAVKLFAIDLGYEQQTSIGLTFPEGQLLQIKHLP